jgi:hypothetical protein
MKTLENFTKHQIIEALFKYASNQKKCDKYSVAYMAQMIDFNTGGMYTIFLNHYKRSEILFGFKTLVLRKGFDQLIKSENIKKEVLTILNK